MLSQCQLPLDQQTAAAAVRHSVRKRGERCAKYNSSKHTHIREGPKETLSKLRSNPLVGFDVVGREKKKTQTTLNP
ncbi:carbonic anhydrase [Anopheles sinensis]|uniref:Carbonic anhydrase n=1 Tax=Anopheles sinensis TaxID=74873 RepID=A0A084VVZ9_ANOSI|nr:carbonic anhydrase [Anopheles sinensis]